MPLKSPLLLLLSLSLTLTLAQPTLKLVIELFRHGGRAPESTTYDHTWPGNSYGELTNDGMRQHFYLGTGLLAQYNSILGQPYDPAKIYVRASDVNRTIMSVTSQLMAIYQGTGPNLPADLPQGVDTPPYNFNASILANLTNAALPQSLFLPPIHVVQETEDFVLQGHTDVTCPKAKDYTKHYSTDGSLYKEVSDAMQSTLANLSSIYGSNITLNDGDSVGDMLICDYYERRTPPNFTEAPFSELWNQTTFMFYFVETSENFQSTFQQQLYSTPTLGYILDTVTGVVNGSSSLEFVFLSAHDTTLLTVLSALNHTTADCLWSNYQNNITDDDKCNYPIFASQIFFELWLNGTDYHVNMIYNGINMYDIHNDSGFMMSYSGFQELVGNATGNMTMEQYMDYCGLGEESSKGDKTLKYVIYAMIGVTGALFVAVVVAMVVKYKRLRKVALLD